MGISVPMYALMVAIGAVSYLLYYKLFVVKRENIDRVTDNRLVLVSILGFIALGVSAFIMNSIFHSIEQGKLVFGGITWLGGVIGCIPSVYVLIHVLVPKEKGNALNRFSTMMPGLVLAHGFGRIGCFFGGCCYGARTDGFLGISFPATSSAGNTYPDYNASVSDIVIKEVLDKNGNVMLDEMGNAVTKTFYPSLPVLPTQLFEAVFAFIIFAVMIAIYKKAKNYNVEIYCYSYGIFRFVLEFWRGDSRGETGFALSPSQLMSIIICIGATLLILYKKNIIFKKIYAKCEAWREEAETTTHKSRIVFYTPKKAAEMIKELFEMKESGIISVEEYEKKKEELLTRI